MKSYMAWAGNVIVKIQARTRGDAIAAAYDTLGSKFAFFDLN